MAAADVSTRAAFSVHTSGSCAPVASAKPATKPDASAVTMSYVANTVPLVPSDTTTSPGWIDNPSAAAMLSPVPGPTTIPPGPAPAGWDGPFTRGVPITRPNASSSRSSRYAPVAGDQYAVPDASPRSVTSSPVSR